MILSMTGYGKAQYEDDRVFIKVEIKSVNSKQFDLKLRLPVDFSFKETWARSELQKLLFRGKVECHVTVERYDQMPFEINEKVADQYFAALAKLAKKYGYNIRKIDALQIIMRLPDVLRQTQNDEDYQTWENVWKTILQAVEQLRQFRIQEGRTLEADLREKVQNIQNALNQVPKYEKERIETVRQRLLDALSQAGTDYDKQRFEQELLYWLDKLDINEEKVRLQNHINYFLQTLDKNQGKPVGKTLNFIAQEMGREINTLGAKANHYKIQHLVVQMKDNLEQIKEQLANVL